MCKSKLLFSTIFCLSILLVSCSDHSEIVAPSDAQKDEISSYFTNENPDDLKLFGTEDPDLKSTPVISAMDIPPVLYGPDLIISKITTTLPSNPTPCSPDPMRDATCNTFYTVTMDVRNIGNVTVPAGHVAALYNTISASTANRTVQISLAPGQATTLTVGPFNICSGSVPPTNEQFIAFADYWDDIDESREFNNRSRPYNFCLN